MIFAFAVMAMLVAVGLPFASETFSKDASSGTSITERNVVVYSDDLSSITVKIDLSDYTSKVISSYDLESDDVTEIAVFDSSWIKMNDTFAVDSVIANTVSSGIPAIFIGSDNYLLNKSGLNTPIYGSSEDETVYCWYQHCDGINFYYSVGGELTEALKLAYAWADEILSYDPYMVVKTSSWTDSTVDIANEMESVNDIPYQPLGATTTGATWALLTILSHTANLYSNGSFTVTTEVYKLVGGVGTTTDFYSFHYYEGWGRTASTSGSARVADIKFVGTVPISNPKMQPNMGFIGSGPVSTSGTSGVATTLQLGFGMSGDTPKFDISLSRTWSYSISDVVIKNTTTLNKLNIWHDIAENKNVGYGYQAQPSVTLAVPYGSAFIFFNFHSVNVCKEQSTLFGLLTKYTDFTESQLNFEIFVSGPMLTSTQF
jgi:hypothetical protein